MRYLSKYDIISLYSCIPAKIHGCHPAVSHMEYKVYAAIRFIVKCIAVMNIRFPIGTNHFASGGAYMNAAGCRESIVCRNMDHSYTEWTAGISDTVHGYRVPIADHLRL